MVVMEKVRCNAGILHLEIRIPDLHMICHMFSRPCGSVRIARVWCNVVPHIVPHV